MALTPKRHAPRGPLIKRDLMDQPDLMEPARCSAKAKGSQKQCKRPPIAGGTVCYIHGGAAPQVKLKAMERLLALQDPAIDRLTQLIAQEAFPTVAYAASRDVLDRTLGKPVEQQHVQHSGGIEITWKDSE